jgi:hypothetical protein
MSVKAEAVLHVEHAPTLTMTNQKLILAVS